MNLTKAKLTMCPQKLTIQMDMFRNFLLLTFMLGSQSSLACVCIKSDYETSFKYSDIVIKGHINSILDLNDTGLSDYYIPPIVFLYVEEKVKGERITKFNVIPIIQDGSNCDFQFEKDSSYIVFGDVIRTKYDNSPLSFVTTHQCKGTQKIPSIISVEKHEALSHQYISSPLRPLVIINIALLCSILCNLFFAYLFISGRIDLTH